MTEITLPTTFENKIGEDKRINLLVIGAGGTGGYLVPNLARAVSLKNKQRELNHLPPHSMTLMDADEVELKNLNRQNFTRQDIGKNKAEVLAQRYSRAFSTDINFIADYLESTEDLVDIFNEIGSTNYMNPDRIVPYVYGYVTVVVDCVDNIKTRHFIKEAMNKLPTTDFWYISSGNEERAGQVVISHKNEGELNRLDKIDLHEKHENENYKKLFIDLDVSTPDVIDIFQESMKPTDKLPGEMSCAEHAVSSPQNISANIMASTYLFSILNKMLSNEPITELMIMFDSKNLSTKTYYNQVEDMASMMELEGKANPYMLDFFSKTYLNLRYSRTVVTKMKEELKRRKEETSSLKFTPSNELVEEEQLEDYVEA